MNVIASVLAGQGAARILEWFAVSDVLAAVAAVVVTFLVSIGLFIWKKEA